MLHNTPTHAISFMSGRQHKQEEQSGTGQHGGRGFAGMDPQRQHEIASKGGTTAQAHRAAH